MEPKIVLETPLEALVRLYKTNRSAREIIKSLGWEIPSEEQQEANLSWNLSEIHKDNQNDK